MSADLFAEFATPSTTPLPQAQQQKQSNRPAATSFSFFDDFTAAAPAPVHAAPQSIAPSDAQQEIEEDDDWGDFEGDTASFEKPPLVKQDSFAFVAAAATRARAPTLPPTQERVSAKACIYSIDMLIIFPV